MNSAIVDAAKIQGTKLYATTYTEPGIQNAATPTYTTSKEVLKQIADDPNIVEKAKNELANRYNQSMRETIDSAIQSDADKNEGSLANKNTRKHYKNTRRKKEIFRCIRKSSIKYNIYKYIRFNNIINKQ